MHSLLTPLVTVAFVAAGTTAAVEAGANAGGTKCSHVNPATGVCVLYVEVTDPDPSSGTPPDDGPKDTGPGAACYWDGTAQGISNPPPGPVPCSSPGGYWSNGYRCYISTVSPQPPAGDPTWQGHHPGDGAVYNCYQPETGILLMIWAQDAPPNSGVGPSPRQVAQLAINQMHLAAIDIGIAPKPEPNSIGLVGMPVWMWAKNPGDHTVGPITSSASAGGITITATARLLRVTWDMGDTNTVICKTAGTPYEPSFGRQKSPDCGHVYRKSSADKPGRKFTVSATSDWVVTWSGAGQTGTIRLGGLTRSTHITIGEAQVLVD
jgi:hypothetical protein